MNWTLTTSANNIDNINSLKMSIAEYSVELIVTNWNEGPNLAQRSVKAFIASLLMVENHVYDMWKYYNNK